MKTKLCPACGKFFFWGVSERGRFVPLDEDPSNDGEYVLMTTNTPPSVARHESLSELELVTFRHRYACHTRTCKGRQRGAR